VNDVYHNQQLDAPQALDGNANCHRHYSSIGCHRIVLSTIFTVTIIAILRLSIETNNYSESKGIAIANQKK
jgi:hypothetical protein